MNYAPRIPFFLIWRFITRSNKWTLGLTVFLMAVAFINLLFISSLFNGIIEGTNDQVINTYAGHLNIIPADGQETIPNAAAVRARVEQTDHVVAASAETLVPGTLQYKNIKGSWQVLAINPNQEKTVTNVAEKMISGTYLDPGDENGIIIGRQIAGGPDVESNAFSFKGAQVGEAVTLNAGGVIKDFIIRGIFYTKFINTDQRAFITETAWEEMMPAAEDQATNIIIRLDKRNNVDIVTTELQALGIDGQFSPWQDMAGLMKTVTKSFLSINVLMTFVGVLIAAVTIFIVIYIDINNKKRQIGIMRAIGIKPYLIRTTYVLQTVVYSVAGVALGTAIFFGGIVPYFNWHPFVLPICDAVLKIAPADFIIRMETVFLVAIGSGLIPAFTVTRMKILNAVLGK